MHLNKNTTLELIDTTNQSHQSSARKQMSPFSVKQQRKKFVEERGQAIQQQILQQYSIEPFHGQTTAFPPHSKTPGGIADDVSSSRDNSRNRLGVVTPTQYQKAGNQPFSERKP